MKGHMQDGKFHPHTQYQKGTRKSRDQNAKSEGIKIRKARDQDLVYAESYNRGQNIKVVGHGNDWMLLVDRNVVGRAVTKEDIFKMYDKVNTHPESGSPRFFDPRAPRSFAERKARENLTNKDKQILRDWVKQNPNWTSIDDLPNKIFIPLVSSAGDDIDKRVEIQVKAIDFMKSVTPKSKKQMHERKARETRLPKDVLKTIKEDFATKDIELDSYNPKWKLYEVYVDSDRYYMFPDEDSALAFGRQSIRDTATEYIPDKGTENYDEWKDLKGEELVEKIIEEQSQYGQLSELGAVAKSVAGYDGEYHELSNGWIGFQID